ncbi:MAG: hypothetical protein ACKOKB_08390 [Bacteroidota bacterium]|jgi:hypothetical protein
MKTSRSRKKAKEPVEKPLIKVQLDERTTITIRKMEMLKFWKERYPAAKVI